jgi:hypothetical protein
MKELYFGFEGHSIAVGDGHVATSFSLKEIETLHNAEDVLELITSRFNNAVKSIVEYRGTD